MQRYELNEGSSSKFWEAIVEGAVLKVRFGRIGTSGQSKDKDFPNAEAAQREFDKLVREKTSKGYRAADGNPASVEPINGDQTIEQGTETAVPKPKAKPVAKASTKSATASIDEQDKATIFSGTALPSRMRPGKPFDPAADWAAFAGLMRVALADVPETAGDLVKTFVSLLDDEPEPLTIAEASEFIERLRTVCPGADQRPWNVEPTTRNVTGRKIFEHFLRWLAARSGANVLAGCIEVLRPRPISSYGTMPASIWEIPNIFGLRSAVTSFSEADYEVFLAECLRLQAEVKDRYFSVYLTYLLADDRETSEHDLRAVVQLPLYAEKNPGWGNTRKAVPLIAELKPSVGAPWYADTYQKAELQWCDMTAAEAAATATAIAREAGEPTTPPLAWLLRDAAGANKTIIAKALLDTRADDAVEAILPFVTAKLVRDALDAADAAFPAWMARAYLAQMSGKGEAAFGPRLVTLLGQHGPDNLRHWASEGPSLLSSRLEKILAERNVPLAPREAWPGVLADPPWRRKAKASHRVELAIQSLPTPFVSHFKPQAGINKDSYSWRTSTVVKNMDELIAYIEAAEEGSKKYSIILRSPTPIPARGTPVETVLDWLDHRFTMFQSVYTAGYADLLRGVAWQPDAMALRFWAQTKHLHGSAIDWKIAVPTLISRFGEKAVPSFVRHLVDQPDWFMRFAMQIDAAEIAPAAAYLLAKIKKMRKEAAQWLRAYPRTAAWRLLPVSLGPASPERDAADGALRLIAQDPAGREALDAAIAVYSAVDPRVKEAAATGVDADPLEQVPTKVAKLPGWIVPSSLIRPRVASGEALPDEAIVALCEMLAFSSPLAPYAGIQQVREICTAESLDAFAVDLFGGWIASGANTASEWAMRAMGEIGGNACARDLTRQIRVWGQGGLKPRGKAGIAVLAEIGTDLALMNLSAIAEKNPLLQLREAAKAAVSAVAEARGLEEVELADRLSPDLGLDERGGLDLVYGERRFRVGFDETLKPWVRDVNGQRLPSLPRATKTDDQELAKAASKLWAGLKKDAEATARLQITRLEAMLGTSRRVGPDVFWPFFAKHPLIRHLAGRLVWGLYDDKLPTTRPKVSFRLAEDLTATDAEDNPLDVDLEETSALIGLVHPLHLAPEALARWSGLFGDYEIAQPFAQLGRETFTLTDAEAGGAKITRFVGAKVAGRRLRGLRSQGWATDSNQEYVSYVQRKVLLSDGTELVAVLGFSDGFSHSPSHEGDGIQTLEEITLTDNGWGVSATHRFGEFDPVTASELLRAPSLLAATGGE